MNGEWGTLGSGPLDLEDFRRNGHALVDWVTDYFDGLGNRPVCEPVEPGGVRAKLPRRAPEHAEPLDEVLADLDRVVAPGLAHWQHPGWLAYFPATSSPASVLGELAAAAFGVVGMMWSTSPAATEIESHVLDWLADMLGVPQEWKTTSRGGGVLQSGASSSTDALIANINVGGRYYITGSKIYGRRFIRIAIGSIWATRTHIEELWKLIDANA